MDHFEALFNPQSVAVVGASNSLDKWGAGVFASILRSSKIKRLYPVNNKTDIVQGKKTYPTVRDIPDEIDFAAIVVPFNYVLDVVKDCVAKGVKSALVITAGLGETGEEGAALQKEIVETARAGGMRFVGPNCMGHFNTASSFSTARGGGMTLAKGNIGVISQSGGFAGHILQCGTEMGVGFSKFVSTGNEADLHFEDFFEHYAQDENTKVITAYIEGLREGPRFFKLAREITRNKPVVVVKVGRTSAGVKAARSHTSAIAGADNVYDAMFKQSGVIRVDEVEELFDVASGLLHMPLPKGNKVGILTFGGGFGCVTSDACENAGLEVAQLSPYTIEALNKVLPERWPHANPVDMVGFGEVTYPCLWPMIEDENIDSLIVIGGIAQMGMRQRMQRMMQDSFEEQDNPPSFMEQAEERMREMEEAEQKNLAKLYRYMKKYQKPLIIFNRHSSQMKDLPVFNELKKNGIMMYPTPERAAKVLAHLSKYGMYLNS
ncbi:MAG: CoA-binding protein [Dehalococcoidales bacterium]|nr:CoA-binding protein [Dehalococcoidales bacterium]